MTVEPTYTALGNKMNDKNECVLQDILFVELCKLAKENKDDPPEDATLDTLFRFAAKYLSQYNISLDIDFRGMFQCCCASFENPIVPNGLNEVKFGKIEVYKSGCGYDPNIEMLELLTKIYQSMVEHGVKDEHTLRLR